MSGDPRWEALQSARDELLAKFSLRGVSRVEFVAAFPDQLGAHVWLATGSDVDRDALASQPELQVEVLATLRSFGLPPEDIEASGVQVQSQETVDRDFKGSWFYALR